MNNLRRLGFVGLVLVGVLWGISFTVRNGNVGFTVGKGTLPPKNPESVVSPLPSPTRTRLNSVDDPRALECVRPWVQDYQRARTDEDNACPNKYSPTPSPTPTSTATFTLTPSPTPTSSPTPTPTFTPTWTATPVPPTPTPTPGPTPDGVRRTVRVPILMYHHIATPPPNADPLRHRLSLPPSLFEAQLQYLQQAGYTTITLDDLIYYLTQGRPLPPKPIILTFDDGYRDHYTNAFPLLQKYGFIGTFFIITDLVNQQHPEYLTWDMVREMKAAGMAFGAHGRTHIDLAQADMDQLIWQALGSTEVFQVELGEPARYIAYPSGRYDEEVIAVYKSANYWAGLTTIQGATHSSDRLFELKRIRVEHDTTPDQLAVLLNMDW